MADFILIYTVYTTTKNALVMFKGIQTATDDTRLHIKSRLDTKERMALN